MTLASADFVYTLLVFSLDVTTSVSVYTLGGAATNFTNSMTSGAGNATEAYYFNSTNPNAQLLAPCEPTLVTCQTTLAGIPAYRVRGTGNANTSINLKLSTVPSGVSLAGNSTQTANCGGATGVMTYVAGNINATDWARVASQLGTNSPCFDVNVSLYATFSSKPTGASTAILTINSTLAP